MRGRLTLLYGRDRAEEVYEHLERLLRAHHAFKLPELLEMEASCEPTRRFSHEDAILITYGDLIVSPDRPPLRTLADLAQEYFRGLITTIHLLPFYPWSSDRGFSVLSYWLVDRNLGTWDDVASLDQSFDLMFDGVFNHVSSHSRWFQEFLASHPDFEDFFISFSSPDEIRPDDLRRILRPRTSNLLTPVHTAKGLRYVWTTFSSDQVDLNFRNPRVLLEILSLLLYYVRRGADLIRLDAVTYLWKELGTSCAHLPQTHECIKLLRDALDVAAPYVALVTETNVPHEENVSYFGDGSDEAQMVYNFALPPLVLHTFQSGNASALTRWARSLEFPSETTHFLNFLSSHDGIGLMGARGILSDEEILAMCRRTEDHGGFVSMRTDPTGGESPYELNVTWFSALNRRKDREPIELQVDRFVASRAVALALRGVPGIYMPALIGSRNDVRAVLRTNSRRDINRTAIRDDRLRELMAEPSSVARRIFRKFVRLLEIRVSELAFDPRGAQEVLDLSGAFFALLRTSPDGASRVLCLINVTARPQRISLGSRDLQFGSTLRDIVTDEVFSSKAGSLVLETAPYQVLLLRRA
jgi:sucrose phosphorylase